MASNIHYGTPVTAIRPSSDLQFCQQESELSLVRSEPGHCRKSESHCVSISSQSTTLSISGMARSSSIERKQPNGRPICRNSGNFGSRGSIRASSGVPLENGDPGGRLSTIAEKLRRGTKKVLQFSKSPSTSPTKTSSTGNVAPADHQDGKSRWLRKKESVDSVDTNTISNSSLKEYDEEEFSSAELARFMAEINNEIR